MSMRRSRCSHTCCHCRYKRPPLPELLLFRAAADFNQEPLIPLYAHKAQAGIINCPCSLSLAMDSLMASLMILALSPDLKPHPMPHPAVP